ncbi:ribosomal protein L4 [Tilletiaria anomala UBC 951]|uniref:Large ribosomal subunit protein uL4m n=1 Tax=Tilletiaria anomala (strain ATCC 24038 / CBS 436.72 / UBC 951) TaxID=1037660 RepID=A0A066WDZ0_TILAU|nr:ribosomal protein L4 [Tilletiaria anomala UBC 951]KDN52172.1 ribosomal protein L4 [Tilletiaria anomala UBC 951]
MASNLVRSFAVRSVAAGGTSSGVLRSSSLATSSRVQLQHFLAAAEQYTASDAPSRALSRAGASQKRCIHGSQPLDPFGPSTTTSALPPNLSAPSPSASHQNADTMDTTPSEALDALASSEDHVHVRLSWLHPATKALPIDAPYTTSQLHNLPSLVHAGAQHLSTTKAYVPLSSHVFGTTPRRDVLHAAVVYYLDGLRSGTASTKTRGEVAGSRRKVRPQKGSGKARLGRRNNPLLRGGGVIHGPKPRSHATSLPRQVRELALRSALSAKWLQGDLIVVPTMHWDAPPSTTGSLRRILQAKQWDDALFLTAPREPQSALELRRNSSSTRPSAADPFYMPEQLRAHRQQTRNIALALGNIPKVELIELQELTKEAHLAARKPEQLKKPGELHAYEVLHRKKLILDLGAVEWLEEKLGGAVFHLKEDFDDDWEDALWGESAEEGQEGELEEAAEELSEEEAQQLEEDDLAAQKLVDENLEPKRSA